jgi:NAD(P)-dependent dehydrogenase (short-subunit alcohol dehydrogenase family)
MAYSGAKGGVLGLVKTDALDYGRHKIRVNCVAPGNTVTPMLSSTMGEAHINMYSANTPLQRLGQPVDVGNAVAWLSSPMAAYITGILLPVDGGLQLKTGPM